MGRRIEPPLPVWEQSIYWLVGVSGLLYGIYTVYLTSLELQDKLQFVEEGAKILGRKQDVSDYEWYMYSTYFCWKLPPILLAHVAVSRAMFLLNLDLQTRKCVYVLSGAVGACCLQSWRFVLLLGLTPVPFLMASALHSLPAVWALNLAVIGLCNYHLHHLLGLLGLAADPVDHFVVVYIWACAFMRCTYFAVERVWASKQLAHVQSTSVNCQNSSHLAPSGSHQSHSAHRSRTKSTSLHQQKNGCLPVAQQPLYGWPVLPKVPAVFDMYLFVFYTPVFYCGPSVTFKSFTEQMESPAPMSRERLRCVLWGAVRVCFWFFFNNVMLHYLYFRAFGDNYKLMESVNKWTLGTSVFLIGQFMVNKYVVIFGSMRLTAKLDGLDLAENPACMIYILQLSDLWKTFDRGLYSCLKRYIYVPLGGAKKGLLRREMASLVSFLGVGYWHGGDTRCLLWALLNFLIATSFLVENYLGRLAVVQKIPRLPETVRRRLWCLPLYPRWLMCFTSGMSFLVGPEFARIYFSRICLQWDSFVVNGVIFYCFAHCAVQLERLGFTRLS